MTTQTDHLKLIKSTIDTQYDLARIELFRPFEIFDRYHGIKLHHDCGPASSHHFTSDLAYDIQRTAAEWDDLAVRINPFIKVGKEVDGTGITEVTWPLYENTGTCRCGAVRVKEFSVRVSILWNGRTLMREYVLPEVGK